VLSPQETQGEKKNNNKEQKQTNKQTKTLKAKLNNDK